MYFTVHDLVTKNIFPDLRIAAGIGGIDNKITSLNSTDILHDPGCFQAGELIFTTGYDFLDELKYTRFLPELAAREIAGLVLQTGRYQSAPPSYFVFLANQLNIPLLTISDNIPFPNILNTLIPLINSDNTPSWSTTLISKAKSFFERCAKEHYSDLFCSDRSQLIRLILIESESYKEVSETKWKDACTQVRSFIQANTYFYKYEELSTGHFAFVVAHEPEDSPSMMYRLHLKFISLSEKSGINFLLGNDYYLVPEQLNVTLQRAAEGLNTLHLLKAKRGVCTYESIQFIRMLSYFRLDESSIFMENQAFKLLHNYDTENGTEYMNTLRIYMSSNCNIARTAKLLFIHRNTLINRLERIGAISGIRLEDYYARIHIMVALMFHDYFSP